MSNKKSFIMFLIAAILFITSSTAKMADIHSDNEADSKIIKVSVILDTPSSSFASPEKIYKFPCSFSPQSFDTQVNSKIYNFSQYQSHKLTCSSAFYMLQSLMCQQQSQTKTNHIFLYDQHILLQQETAE